MAKLATAKEILAADLFCGAGGTSSGMVLAANELKAKLKLVAVNHWDIAIDTHSANHEYADHFCTGIDSVDPRKLVPGGFLHLLCASPECTHHSNARGGKPMSDQSRSSGWHVLRFAEALYIENIVLENVPEWVQWGPLGKNGRPLKSKRGELFQQFINSLKALGYSVEWKVLNCADYGEATSRRRLFVIARRGNKKITWPEPTHAPARVLETPSLFSDERKPWRTAREVIDWDTPSQSIFARKKPLKANTIKRIEAGVKKFWGVDVDIKRCLKEDLRPFLVIMRNNCDARSVDEPIPTVTAGGTHVGLVEPFMVGAGGPQRHGEPRAVNKPMQTVLTRNTSALVQPFMVTAGGAEGQGRVPASIEEPIGTVLTHDRRALVEPFVLQTDQTGGNGKAVRSIDRPLPTVVTKANTCLVEPLLTAERPGPFLLGQQSGATPRSIDEPTPTVAAAGAISLTRPFLVPNFGERKGQAPRTHSIDDPTPTVTSHGAGGVVEPFIVTVNHGDGDSRRSRSLDDPMPTITGSLGDGIIEPFIVEYYGTQNMAEVDSPLPTVTGNDRFALVEGVRTERFMLDIHFRMLQPRELARAQGFPDTYRFSGSKKDAVKMIGNAVPVNMAKALIHHVLSDSSVVRKAA